MTLLNVQVTPARADIWSDGAWIDLADGRVRQFVSKAIILEGIPAVVAVSGHGDAGVMAYLMLRDQFDSFDNLEAGAVARLQTVKELAEEQVHLILFLVGWSDKHNAVRGVLITNKQDYPGVAQWAVTEVERAFQPNPPGFYDHLEALGIDVQGVRPLTKLEAYKIAMEQRAMRGHVEGYPNAKSVGGFLSHVVVTQHGVYANIEHRWPDRIGQRIEVA